MCIKAAVSAIAGAIVVFAWSCASWMYLPWHNLDMKVLQKEGAVITESIKVETPTNGLYVLPHMAPDLHTNPEAQKAWATKAQQGPFVFMVVNAKGIKWDMKTALIIQFITQLVVALGAVWLLGKCVVGSIFKRGVFISVAVTLGAILMNVSNWNWWGFPINTTLVNIADVAIGWFLAGIVMGTIKRT